MSENNFFYKPMLEIKTIFNPSDNQLNILAEFMSTESKGIPAGYTYLGQFIDHDMSLDSTNNIFPWKPILAASIYNKRTPWLNLETIYGFEYSTDQNEPSRDQLLAENSRTLLKLGDTDEGVLGKSFANRDLPRRPDSAEALIVDSRNDENLAVAQTQVAFMKFHNAVVKYLTITKAATDTTETFEKARKIVIQHYQWIILKDYLPKIIKTSVLNDVLTEGNQFYFPDSEAPFLPLEFSVAAFRIGHSMIRKSYNWNIIFNNNNPAFPAGIEELTQITGRCGLDKKKKLPSQWLINWNWFYEITINSQGQNFNYASEIDTKITRSLGFLPSPNSNCTFSQTYNRETSLPALDLYRARALGLPSGQMVAKTILGTEEQILKPEQIANLLPANLKYSFSKETPLWFYLLAEAEIEERGKTLGKVGSRIIAETFVELIKTSKIGEFSIFKDDFKPIPEFCSDGVTFGMSEMLKVINRYKSESYDELDTLGEDNEVKENIENIIFN